MPKSIMNVLQYAKETRNTVVYHAIDQTHCAVPSLYIRKSHIPKPYPTEVQITIKISESSGD